MSWDIPGGHREVDERPIATAVRELHEETGIAVTHSNYQFAVRQPAGITFVYTTRRLHKVSLSSEHTGYGWFSAETAQELPMSTVYYNAILGANDTLRGL